MKLLTIASALLATASAGSFFGGPEVALDDSLSVPGDNPLQHCANPKDDILTIESVDLSPNPPKAGTTLSITAKGDLAEDVEEGAKVHLQVKYGLITIIKQEADLCNTVKEVDLECPIKKGETALTKKVELPKQIPPGKYTVLADVISKDDKKITCLTATVEFHRDGSLNVVENFKADYKQTLKTKYKIDI
ncbi:hypothetical protein Q7P37_005929 [Cladosporium fusiforme]